MFFILTVILCLSFKKFICGKFKKKCVNNKLDMVINNLV